MPLVQRLNINSVSTAYTRGMFILAPHTKLGCDLQQQSRAKRTAVVTNAYQFDVSVRPYTLRKGDTLKSIAQKRGKQRLLPASTLLSTLQAYSSCSTIAAPGTCCRVLVDLAG
jgi:hypothetical protein